MSFRVYRDFSECICLEYTKTVYTKAFFLSTLIIHSKSIWRVMEMRCGAYVLDIPFVGAHIPHPSNAPQQMRIAAGEAGRDQAKWFYFTFAGVAFGTFPHCTKNAAISSCVGEGFGAAVRCYNNYFRIIPRLSSRAQSRDLAGRYQQTGGACSSRRISGIRCCACLAPMQKSSRLSP